VLINYSLQIFHIICHFRAMCALYDLIFACIAASYAYTQVISMHVSRSVIVYVSVLVNL